VQSLKLSITVKAKLEQKYPAAARARLDAAVAAWIKADGARGIRTVHVAVDDPAGMKPYGVPALKGQATADKIKRTLDALVATLSPDYIVLFGSGDIVPHFSVKNPSRSKDDDDPAVPTDNPYACSAKFDRAKVKSYLVPDRVLGRIPDVPGDPDPSWFERYLSQSRGWKPKPASAYKQGFYACAATWRKAGESCVETLKVRKSDLLIVPPVGRTTPRAKTQQRGLRHMIKCHGMELDSAFYGETTDPKAKVEDQYPETLRSPDLQGRAKKGAVIGAMCCYGAGLFNPANPRAVNGGEPPISSQYLKLGAHGFLGSSTTAWVGDTEMMCADWIVTSFLKGATGGASLGRAALESKQDFLRWIQQQGATPDAADKKTLIQFMLLGDPSIHPVVDATARVGPKPAGRTPIPRTAAITAAALPRRLRRAARHQLGALLRSDLPVWKASKSTPPKQAADAARALLASVPDGGQRTEPSSWSEQTVLPAPAGVPPLAPTRVAAALRRPARGGAAAPRVAAGRTYQYYWTTRHKVGRVRRITLVTVETDAAGQVISRRVVVSS
jgi:hypothetical protein